MQMPSPPDNNLRLSLLPHPATGEQTACLSVTLDEGHALELWLPIAILAELVADMQEALTILWCSYARWMIVNAPTVEGAHLMDKEAFVRGRRRALCGVHPPKGTPWNGLPLVGTVENALGVCPSCAARSLQAADKESAT